MGLGLLLCFLADDEGDLVRLDEPADELDTELWILSHPALKGVARIKALTDFLNDKLRASDKLFHVSVISRLPRCQLWKNSFVRPGSKLESSRKIKSLLLTSLIRAPPFAAKQ